MKQPTVRSTFRDYWTTRLPVRRWVFVVLWFDVALGAMNAVLKWVAQHA